MGEGGTRPPGRGAGGSGGNGGSTNAHPNAATNGTSATPPRPRLARSASSSSRRSALGVLDGNSPKRGDGMGVGGGGGAGGGGKRGPSKSPKRSLSKSPLRRGGSSTVALRRSTSIGRGSSILGDRGGGGNPTASAHASASNSTLVVVHEDAAGADTDKVPTEEELPPPPPTQAEASKPAAAALPPKVPDRAPSAPRGILRPPVYSHSQAGVTTDVASEQQLSSNIHIPSQPTVAATAVFTADAKAAPVPVARPAQPSTAGDNATDSDDEVDAGFNDFMNELMEEVAPDHTEVRCCFAIIYFMVLVLVSAAPPLLSFGFQLTAIESRQPIPLPALGRLPVFLWCITKVEAAPSCQLQGRGGRRW